jgi:hypothetical protein
LQDINQAIKGVIGYVYKLILLQEEITILYIANDLLSRYRCMKKQHVQEEEVLIVEDIQDLEAQREADIQLQADLQESRG